MARSLTTWMTIRYWIPGEINGSVGSGVVINCWWGFVKLAGSAETGGHTKSCANRSSRPWAWMKPGQVVITQHMLSRRWDQQATILESCSNGHSYIVKINGRSFPTPKPKSASSYYRDIPGGSHGTWRTKRIWRSMNNLSQTRPTTKSSVLGR